LHPAFVGSAAQRLGAHVRTSQLELLPADSNSALLGLWSRTRTLKVTAATAINASTDDIDNTTTSPRRMGQPNSSMNDIERWFERAARREDRAVSLYASLLTGRIVKYFGYRMRYALLLDGTRYVIHVAEFLIILTSLGGLAAFTVMMLRVSSLIVSGA
jgi:hypothetical protein